MSASIDAVSRGSKAGTFIEQNHPVAGDDRLLIAILGNDQAADIVTGITYDGVSMERIGSALGGTNSIYVYSLRHPTLGNNLLRANLSGSRDVILVGLSLNGAIPGTTTSTKFSAGAESVITLNRDVPVGGIRIAASVITLNASGDPIATIAVGEVEQAQIEFNNRKMVVGTTDHPDPAPEWTLDNPAVYTLQVFDVVPAFANLEAVPSLLEFDGQAILTNVARFRGSANVVISSSGLATVIKTLTSVLFVPFESVQTDTVDFFEAHEKRRGRSR